MTRILMLGGFAESLLNFRGDLLKEMVLNGHEVHACAPEVSESIKVELQKMGVSYHSVPFQRTGINPISDVIAIRNLFILFRSIKPDVFLGYTIKPVIYGSISARLAGVPDIYTMITGLGFSFSDSTLKSRFIGFIARSLYRQALKFNQYVFFQNPDDLNLFQQKGICLFRKAVLINGSGVDIYKYSVAKHSLPVSFLLIARLIRDKGIYEYAMAARRLRLKYPEIKFRLVGWPDKNPNSIDENDLRDWQNSGDIEFLGKLDDVRLSLTDCSVYVLPSYREGTPRTILEAMAMGRPIITTDAPGCRETVKQGLNGYLVKVRDVDSLVDAMESFIKQPGLIQSMGQASRVLAEEKYDVRKVNKVILKTMGIIKD